MALFCTLCLSWGHVGWDANSSRAFLKEEALAGIGLSLPMEVCFYQAEKS